MSHKITDDCTCCGVCVDSCPVDAIVEGESKMNIDEAICTDCGVCECECPVEAIEAQ